MILAMKMREASLLVAACAGLSALQVSAAEPVDFNKHVKPILESACIGCHGPDKDKGDLRLDTAEWIAKGGEYGKVVVPGKPEESSLYTMTVLPHDDDDLMPPEDPLAKVQTDVLKAWIEQGAKFPGEAKLQQVRRIDFVKDIQPIFEFNCVACHRDDYDEGDFSMTSFKSTMETGDIGDNLKPFDTEESGLFYSMDLPADDESLMPPVAKGGPLEKSVIETVRLWIQQGAVWPEGLLLEPKKKAQDTTGDDLNLVRAIREMIMAKQEVDKEADMKAYKNQIPDSVVYYEMVPVPGGQFTMGSPAGEGERRDDEGPQHPVKISPFWMGKYELTWNEFELFMYANEAEKQFASAEPVLVAAKKLVHACTRPTKPYVEMSFGMGKDGYPAISMTQHSARKFTQWLSAKTGHFYRLPTEAEWEYACRAGTSTTYSFGNDDSKFGQYGWFEDNSDWKYQKVGKKKPNQWGLFDMHGNVAEWCLDAYEPAGYAQFKELVENPLVKPIKLYPRVARGGSWDHPTSEARSAARMASNADWKIQDPQLPKSIWWHTDAQFLGMRLVRPLEVPSAEEMFQYWNNGRPEGE